MQDCNNFYHLPTVYYGISSSFQVLQGEKRTLFSDNESYKNLKQMKEILKI